MKLHATFKGHCKMGQKVIVRFWWDTELSSASRNHLTSFFRPFTHYARLTLCSVIVHFIQNNCLCFVCYGWSAQALTTLAALPISVCSMIELLHELESAIVNTEAFRHLIMSQQGKRKTKSLLDFHT